MATIVLRSVKGSALSFAEADANFDNLNTEVTAATADIVTLQGDVAQVTSDLGDHILASPAHAGADISVDASGFSTLSSGATTAQLAFDEVDTALGSLSTSQIIQGHSDIEVIDAGTGSIVYTVDGAVQMRNDPNTLTFSPTGYRFLVDMSSGTVADRAWWKTSVTNGNTSFGVLPNGTSTQSQFLAVDDATPTNSSFVALGINGTNSYLNSGLLGTGAALPFTITVNSVEVAKWTTAGGAILGSTEYDAGNSSTAITIDMNNGQNQRMTLTGNAAVTLSNPKAGMKATLRVLTGTGGFTVSFSTSVKWPGGAAYVASTAASQIDIITLTYLNGQWYGQHSNGYA